MKNHISNTECLQSYKFGIHPEILVSDMSPENIVEYFISLTLRYEKYKKL